MPPHYSNEWEEDMIRSALARYFDEGRAADEVTEEEATIKDPILPSEFGSLDPDPIKRVNVVQITSVPTVIDRKSTRLNSSHR